MYRKLALHRRVTVNLTTDKAFEGILWSEKGPLIVLRDAFLFTVGEEPTKVDGDVLIERYRIDFVQVTG